MGYGSACKSFWKEIWEFRNVLVIILTPILLLPLPLVIQTDAAKCGYVLILMAVLWTTEALPLAVTSLFPLVLLPLMGVMKAKELSKFYFKDTNALFVGGLVVAIAIEKSNIHQRVALKILTLVGAKPIWLMLGFMAPTWFMSMWISNTASTAMMMPVVGAVIDLLESHVQNRNKEINADGEKLEISAISNGDISENTVSNNKNGTENQNSAVTEKNKEGSALPRLPSYKSFSSKADLLPDMEASQSSLAITPIQTGQMDEKRARKFKEVCTSLSLCVAYAANVGGTATLTGTTPNLIMKGAIDSLYEKKGLKSPVTFATWMGMCFPAATIMLFLIWICMQFVFLGFRDNIFTLCCKKTSEEEKHQETTIKEMITKEYKSLGPVRFNEVAVSFFFVLVVLLWFFREPGFMPGWAKAFKDGYTSESTPAIFVAILVFIFPSQWPNFLCFRRCKRDKEGDGSKRGPVPALLDWPTCQEKMPWNVVLLLGGGFALAEAVTRSGLASWIGAQLTVFKPLPGWLLVLILCIIVAFLTQVTSNSATATILMPIMATLAEGIGKNPLYLMFPVAVSTSFAFMLPVATPPNAIAYATGRIKVVDMARGGVFLNFICVFVITLAVHTWGMAIFNFNVIPWATTTAMPNVTEVTTSTSLLHGNPFLPLLSS